MIQKGASDISLTLTDIYLVDKIPESPVSACIMQHKAKAPLTKTICLNQCVSITVFAFMKAGFTAGLH